MNVFRSSASRAACAGLAMLALLPLGAGAPAALAADPFFTLQDTRLELDRLAQPDQLTQTAVFEIDTCTLIRVDIVSDNAELATSITGPAGQVVTPATIESLGGFYLQYEGGGFEGIAIAYSSRPGFHYHYFLPTLGPGTYTATFTAPPSLVDEAAVVTELITDSPIATAVFTPTPAVLQGGIGVITAAAFNGSTAITDATATARVIAPGGTVSNIPLLDNGVDADVTIGDGLYNALFTATETGVYAITVTVMGTSSGVAYRRTGTTTVQVVPSGATLTGAFANRGIDLNGNGLFDQIAIDAGVTITTAGAYAVRGILRTSDGDEVFGAGEATLAAGAGTISARFEAAGLVATGDNGPFTLTTIELLQITPSGAFPADALVEQTYTTAAYLQSQLERPPIFLTGVTSDSAADTDSDGDFDRLTVNVGIVVRIAGTYDYTVALFNECSGQIEFLTGERNFPGGITPVDLVLNFNGRRIGQDGVGGPFIVKDLAVYGAGGTLVEVNIATTGVYAATQFDGYVAPPDCNGNGRPDACDIADGAGDCDSDGLLDECEPDCNANGTPDDCDLRDGTSQDCNGNSIPDECDLRAYRSADCNADGIPDECQGGALPEVSSTEPAVLGYQSISATGLALDLDDDGVATIDLPLTFSFFPSTFVNVSNNGAMSFGGDPALDYVNQRIPDPFAFSGGQALFVFWDDMDSDTGNVYFEIIGAAPNRTLIVEWFNRPHYQGDTILDGDEATFQIQVFETPIGRTVAQFLYQDVDFQNPAYNNGASASIGYQQNGKAGVEFSFDTAGAVTAGAVLTIRAPQAKTSCRVGDTNCDGGINFDDIGSFVVALTGETGYASAFPACDFLLSDASGNGLVDFDDIGPFIELLIGG